MGLTKENPFSVTLGNYYKLQKSEHGTIVEVADLQLIIRYCFNYPHNVSVRNALIMGLITALMAGNIRFLKYQNCNRMKKDFI